mgnify:CR=1 FL=1|jgi:hypothetical protein|tara:strand:- start:1638 stop:2819 length:1182 start_codon:yes stop_codon:yes gene_type:complete
MKKTCFFILFLFITLQEIQSQELKLSVYSEISIITVGPGEVLFETFGHSAIRVKDSVLGMDTIFNYGLFDFNQPNFYLNFVKGKLIYKIGKQSFQNFVASNNYQKRWMKAQVLNLSQIEKQKMFQLLEVNSYPENANYLYDPYFNNCATKLRDITKEILGDQIQFPTSYSNEDYTMRQLMNKELPWNTWGNFGINLALGSTLDKAITAEEYMYLPDYVYLAFKNAKKSKNNATISLIKNENIILKFKEKEIITQWYNPFFVFSIILLLTIVITYRDQKRNKRSKWLDFLLFFLSGFLGLLICFLWFFTDHSTTPNNFNFLWAFAPNLCIGFVLLKRKMPSWISKYVMGYLVMLALTAIVWVFGIQQFSFAVLPIIAMLIVRNFYLYKLLTSKK